MTFNFTFEIQVSFIIKVPFISVNLCKTSKTSSRTYSKPVKPVVKRSNLCLKMRLIEGGTEVKKESFNDKFNEKRIKYPIHYNIPAHM